ncbi:HAD hydrolase, IIB family protein [Geobacillus kaustophilus]|uniref:HAD hydrolase, IIB family protein n=1 Tax=Geobacillus kaustophilus TaxID=1462 RepID=A0A0D8BX31_GEOKU|nr:Cof-type HAD-IIB family hydrolase [Geobacillus kaustophilus]KJE28559.1 HAD hydrolase, IIB family protein [Geobacillus kaustophilus]
MLIALDMDGTLLNGEGKISERNRKAMMAAQKEGHIVAVITGRARKDALAPLREAGLVCPIASLNGAIVTLEDGTVISEAPLEREIVRPALEWVREQSDLYCETYTGDAVYVGLHNRSYWEALASEMADAAPDVKWLVNKQFQQARVTYVDDIGTVWDDPQTVMYKLLIFALDRERLRDAASRFAALRSVTVTSSHPHNIEMNNERATKGEALKQLAAHYGIDVRDTVAFGDSHNDLSMFKVAGYRVAMDNAEPELKAICDMVTSSHEEDGVAAGLERLLAKRV